MTEQVVMGFAPDQRQQAAQLYWQAFKGKLGRVMGPEAKALAFIERVISPSHALSVSDAGGTLMGIAGFRSPQGGLVDGGFSDLRAVYGLMGAIWRAGALALLVNQLPHGVFAIDAIAVAPQSRGRGTGQALTLTLCDRARSLGYDTIQLEVIDANIRARALYERLGFVARGRHKSRLAALILGIHAYDVMTRTL